MASLATSRGRQWLGHHCGAPEASKTHQHQQLRFSEISCRLQQCQVAMGSHGYPTLPKWRPPTSVAPSFRGCQAAGLLAPQPAAKAPAAHSGWARPCGDGNPGPKRLSLGVKNSLIWKKNRRVFMPFCLERKHCRDHIWYIWSQLGFSGHSWDF